MTKFIYPESFQQHAFLLLESLESEYKLRNFHPSLIKAMKPDQEHRMDTTLKQLDEPLVLKDLDFQ